MQGLILAGGLGTRLRPLTLKTPKPIVPLVNRPLLSYQIELLKRAGINDVILSLNYQPGRIQEVIGDGSQYGVRIRYVVEPEAMGTAGAVKFAGEFIKETTVILNGDNLINLDIAETVRYHLERRAVMTIVLERVENPSAYGLVEIDGENRVRSFLEKPKDAEIDKIKVRTVNAGTYILEPGALDFIPPGQNHSFEYGVFPELLRRKERFFAFVTDSYWLDAGTPARYLQAHQDLINGKVGGFEIRDDRSRSEIAATASVSGNSFIGDRCVIGKMANVSNSVLEDEVTVGENALVENSLIGANTHVGANADIRGAIVGANCRIGAHSAVAPAAVLGEGSVLTDYTKV